MSHDDGAPASGIDLGDPRIIFEAAYDAILILDPDGEIVLDVNPRACEVYGFSKQEFVGMSMQDISANVARGEQQVARTLEVGKHYCFETVQYRKDGSEMHIEVNASVIPYRDRVAILSVNRDATERRRATELRMAKEAAERASESKSRLIASISHELRTPLSGILGLAELLLQRDLDDQSRDYARLILSSSRSLVAVVSDLLDLDRIERDRLTLDDEPYPLLDILREVSGLMAARTANSAVDVVAEIDDAPAWLRGDGPRLRQVLLNLMGNALKFTERGQVTLRASASDVLRVEVEDTGIGVDPAQVPSLFEPFTQADSSNKRRYGGAGLGLAISRNLIESMNGRISATNNAGQGSTFWFEIPLRRAPPPTPSGDHLAALPSRLHRRVLLVEDDPINQLVTRKRLEQLGCAVDLADSGERAVTAHATGRFDIVLMDCQLPGIDGYEATRRIRAHERSADPIPIVALTANAMVENRQRCLAAGMNDYLTKPCTSGELAAMLRRWLDQSA